MGVFDFMTEKTEDQLEEELSSKSIDGYPKSLCEICEGIEDCSECPFGVPVPF